MQKKIRRKSRHEMSGEIAKSVFVLEMIENGITMSWKEGFRFTNGSINSYNVPMMQQIRINDKPILQAKWEM